MTRIVIVGGGFGGLAAAQSLKKAPAEITLFDRTNHHLFQPLLYQVATSVLAPSQIGSPLRAILRKQKNTMVFLGEVSGVDKDRKCVFASNTDRQNVPVSYDYLILATGATHSYFGHPEFEKYAPGLKNLSDAAAIRNNVLQAFERAEAEDDPARRRELLTFVLIGAGPTGVEMSGAIAELMHGMLRSEFRRTDPASARVVLVDQAQRILGTFSEDLSKAATQRLEKLGVEIRLGHSADLVDAEGIVVGGERIATMNIVWTAGVAPSPAGKWLGAETDRAGRVRVQNDLSVPGHPEIFVIGDTMTLNQNGKPLPGVAQVAIQQGRYVGNLIRARLAGKPAPPPFTYFDKGNLAVVGKGFAVLETGKVHLSGFLAWLIWANVHIFFLATSSLRVAVFLQWIWTYLTGQRGSQLIVVPREPVGQKSPAESPRSAAASGK
jgi:NADH dehydrogenase FAD-containing subunit